MNNTWPRRLLWAAVVLSGVFLLYASYLHGRTGLPPFVPSARTGGVPKTGAVRRPPAAGRYARLASGRVFFGGEEATEAGPGVYTSGLTLRGIIQGPRPSAVLTRAGSPPDAESYTVHVGEIVLGEKVAAIGRDYIILSKGGQETVLSLGE